MADNRIYLKCKACGKMLFLGKRFVSGYYWENYGKMNNEKYRKCPWPNYTIQEERPLEERLNEFYTEHEFCDGCRRDCPYEWPDHFEIAYETEPWKGEE